LAAAPGLLLRDAYLGDALVERRGHGLVHCGRVGALDEVWSPAGSLEEGLELLVGNARPDRRVVDLITIQMEDRQYRPIANGIEELVDVPAGGQWPGFGLAIADHGRHDQVGVVERGTTGVRQNVPELAAFVDATGSLGCAVAADAARKREAAEQPQHAGLVLR